MMELYLVRHAEAQERTENLLDDLRHLTRRGRKQAAKLGRRLKKNRVRPAVLITSPLVRAVQTAELLAAELGSNILVTAHAGLSGTADATEVAELLRQSAAQRAVMLVGHEPQLSALAALLLGYEHVAPLAKAGCLALSWKADTQRTAAFNWYTVSGNKLITSCRKALVRPA